MNTYLRYAILFGVAVAILVFINIQIVGKEKLLTTGQIVLLELAPVDPRSLMQGDYMALRYRIARDIEKDKGPRDGNLVVKLDERGVASFVGYHVAGQPLGPGEHLLRFRRRGAGIRLGAESFFFQEGHAKYYSNAKYGELRVDDSGQSVLVGLRGQNLEKLGPDVWQH